MDKPPLFIDYEGLDLWLTSLQRRLLDEAFACVIGVLRGGAPLALMASHKIGAPVAFIRYARATRTAQWDSSLPMPPPGSKVLLCEDIAGRGFTLADSMAFLRSRGLIVRVLTAARDELSRVVPDYSNDASGHFAVFPWERHAYTDAYRADWERTGGVQAEPGGLEAERDSMLPDHRYSTFAIDLDGILLPDLPSARYAADLAAALLERDALAPYGVPLVSCAQRAAAIITGRPDADRERTQRWLDRHGFGGIPLVTRNPAHHPGGAAGAAAHKAEAAIRLGHTLFIESELEQAVMIAERAPLLRVVWWDVPACTARLIQARAWTPID